LKKLHPLAAYEFFNDILGIPADRVNSLNLDFLNLPHMDLAELGDHFTKGEVLAVIHALSPDKAQGLMGSPGGFCRQPGKSSRRT
jgi:hypothetical protein